VLEANPRASRTVPFVSKATAVPLAKAAARIMLGDTIAALRERGLLVPSGDGGSPPADAPIAVKEAVLPFKRFRTRAGKGVDSLLGPEMKSTGEVMGIDQAFGHAFAKSQTAAYGSLPTKGKIFVSVANRDKRGMIFPVKRLADLGFEIVATAGTGEVLRRHGIGCEIVPRRYEEAARGPALGPDQPVTPVRNAVGLIESGEVSLVINTPQGPGARMDGYEIRSAAVAYDVPCITTVQGASAAVMGIEALIRGEMTVRPLQELHAALRAAVVPR
jgi:carbamoyl-phosphate synthase large subunit